MSMIQYDLQFATINVPAEVSHEEIRSTMANAVTDARTKARSIVTTTAEGIIGSTGVTALIMYVFMLLFGKKSKILEIIVYVVVVYLVIANAQAVWTWTTSFVK